jgi:carbon monoxide dehydrogenase subunit G
MIQFEGSRLIALPITLVAAKLSDAGFLVKSLPDSEVAEATPDKAVWKLRPKLMFLAGGLNAELTATAREVGKSVAYKVFTKAMGASSTVVTKLNFRENEKGETIVDWTGELREVTGLLKAVPKGLLQGSAQKVIEDVWTAVTERLMKEGKP